MWLAVGSAVDRGSRAEDVRVGVGVGVVGVCQT